MNKRTILLTFLFILILITACATPYQASGFNGGYSDIQLDYNIFQIRFNGNKYTDKERSSDFALLRCAEVTLQNNFKYFMIAEEDFYYNEFTSTSSKETKKNIEKNKNKLKKETSVTTSHSDQPTKPSNVNTIICYNEKPDSFVYNAELLVKSIKTKYEIK